MSEEAPQAEAAPVEAVAEAPAPAPAPAPVPTEAVDSHWLDGVAEGDTRTWAESKGLRNGSIENVLGSYHNLEKLVGADKAGRTVTLLGDDATQEQTNEFYNKMGRPDNASDYGLTAPEGQSGDFAEWASGTFHTAGLSQKQTAYLAQEWESYVNAANGATETEAQVSRVDAEATLKAEWGAAYDSKLQGIDQAAVKLGMTEDEFDGMRTSMGPVGAMKFVDRLNSMVGEHVYATGEGASDVMTPAAAQLQISQLMSNPEFVVAWSDRMHPGHAAALEKKAGLSRLATGIAA